MAACSSAVVDRAIVCSIRFNVKQNPSHGALVGGPASNANGRERADSLLSASNAMASPPIASPLQPLDPGERTPELNTAGGLGSSSSLFAPPESLTEVAASPVASGNTNPALTSDVISSSSFARYVQRGGTPPPGDAAREAAEATNAALPLVPEFVTVLLGYIQARHRGRLFPSPDNAILYWPLTGTTSRDVAEQVAAAVTAVTDILADCRNTAAAPVASPSTVSVTTIPAASALPSNSDRVFPPRVQSWDIVDRSEGVEEAASNQSPQLPPARKSTEEFAEPPAATSRPPPLDPADTHAEAKQQPTEATPKEDGTIFTVKCRDGWEVTVTAGITVGSVELLSIHAAAATSMMTGAADPISSPSVLSPGVGTPTGGPSSGEQTPSLSGYGSPSPSPLAPPAATTFATLVWGAGPRKASQMSASAADSLSSGQWAVALSPEAAAAIAMRADPLSSPSEKPLTVEDLQRSAQHLSGGSVFLRIHELGAQKGSNVGTFVASSFEDPHSDGMGMTTPVSNTLSTELGGSMRSFSADDFDVLEEAAARAADRIFSSDDRARMVALVRLQVRTDDESASSPNRASSLSGTSSPSFHLSSKGGLGWRHAIAMQLLQLQRQVSAHGGIVASIETAFEPSQPSSEAGIVAVKVVCLLENLVASATTTFMSDIDALCVESSVQVALSVSHLCTSNQKTGGAADETSPTAVGLETACHVVLTQGVLPRMVLAKRPVVWGPSLALAHLIITHNDDLHGKSEHNDGSGLIPSSVLCDERSGDWINENTARFKVKKKQATSTGLVEKTTIRPPPFWSVEATFLGATLDTDAIHATGEAYCALASQGILYFHPPNQNYASQVGTPLVADARDGSTTTSTPNVESGPARPTVGVLLGTRGVQRAVEDMIVASLGIAEAEALSSGLLTLDPAHRSATMAAFSHGLGIIALSGRPRSGKSLLAVELLSKFSLFPAVSIDARGAMAAICASSPSSSQETCPITGSRGSATADLHFLRAVVQQLRALLHARSCPDLPPHDAHNEPVLMWSKEKLMKSVHVLLSLVKNKLGHASGTPPPEAEEADAPEIRVGRLLVVVDNADYWALARDHRSCAELLDACHAAGVRLCVVLVGSSAALLKSIATDAVAVLKTRPRSQHTHSNSAKTLSHKTVAKALMSVAMPSVIQNVDGTRGALTRARLFAAAIPSHLLAAVAPIAADCMDGLPDAAALRRSGSFNDSLTGSPDKPNTGLDRRLSTLTDSGTFGPRSPVTPHTPSFASNTLATTSAAISAALSADIEEASRGNVELFRLLAASIAQPTPLVSLVQLPALLRPVVLADKLDFGTPVLRQGYCQALCGLPDATRGFLFAISFWACATRSTVISRDAIELLAEQQNVHDLRHLMQQCGVVVEDPATGRPKENHPETPAGANTAAERSAENSVNHGPEAATLSHLLLFGSISKKLYLGTHLRPRALASLCRADDMARFAASLPESLVFDNDELDLPAKLWIVCANHGRSTDFLLSDEVFEDAIESLEERAPILTPAGFGTGEIRSALAKATKDQLELCHVLSHWHVPSCTFPASAIAAAVMGAATDQNSSLAVSMCDTSSHNPAQELTPELLSVASGSVLYNCYVAGLLNSAISGEGDRQVGARHAAETKAARKAARRMNTVGMMVSLKTQVAEVDTAVTQLHSAINSACRHTIVLAEPGQAAQSPAITAVLDSWGGLRDLAKALQSVRADKEYGIRCGELHEAFLSWTETGCGATPSTAGSASTAAPRRQHADPTFPPVIVGTTSPDASPAAACTSDLETPTTASRQNSFAAQGTDGPFNPMPTTGSSTHDIPPPAPLTRVSARGLASDLTDFVHSTTTLVSSILAEKDKWLQSGLEDKNVDPAVALKQITTDHIACTAMRLHQESFVALAADVVRNHVHSRQLLLRVTNGVLAADSPEVAGAALQIAAAVQHMVHFVTYESLFEESLMNAIGYHLAVSSSSDAPSASAAGCWNPVWLRHRVAHAELIEKLSTIRRDLQRTHAFSRKDRPNEILSLALGALLLHGRCSDVAVAQAVRLAVGDATTASIAAATAKLEWDSPTDAQLATVDDAEIPLYSLVLPRCLQAKSPHEIKEEESKKRFAGTGRGWGSNRPRRNLAPLPPED